jgi:hypothetical protein
MVADKVFTHKCDTGKLSVLIQCWNIVQQIERDGFQRCQTWVNIYTTLKFLALQGATYIHIYIYDISRLRVKMHNGEFRICLSPVCVKEQVTFWMWNVLCTLPFVRTAPQFRALLNPEKQAGTLLPHPDTARLWLPKPVAGQYCHFVAVCVWWHTVYSCRNLLPQAFYGMLPLADDWMPVLWDSYGISASTRLETTKP